MIQIISGLSSITGKYIYGELFKKKKNDSFVCRILVSNVIDNVLNILFYVCVRI